MLRVRLKHILFVIFVLFLFEDYSTVEMYDLLIYLATESPKKDLCPHLNLFLFHICLVEDLIKPLLVQIDI